MPSAKPDGPSDISIVLTIRNEVASIRDLLEALLVGTVTPGEIVVADGGSTDGTIEVVEEIGRHNPEVRIFTDVGDRSRGRNVGIRNARFDRIATIDGGCRPRSDWLEHILTAFDGGVLWVGAFYEPVGQTNLSTAIGLTMVYVEEEARRHFIPSARSMGFTKELWSEVGGFPDGLQFAEDTTFAQGLLDRGYTPEFTPKAVVEWHPPRTLREQARTMFKWGHGDGLQALRSDHYRRLLGILAIGGVVLVSTVLVDIRLVPLALLPLGPFVARNTRYKYRHMYGWTKWVLIPLASVNGAVSSLIGFLAGRRERLRGGT